MFWILLLLGSLQIPITYGVILAKVEPELRPLANSYATMVYNLLGYFPSPILYGLTNSYLGPYLSSDANHSRLGMKLLMYIQIVVVICYYMAHVSDKKGRRY